MDFYVYYNDRACGMVKAYKEGANFIFVADCDIVSLDICRITLKNGESEVNLGVLMPKNNRYVLKKVFPYSYIKKMNLSEDFSGYILCNGQTVKYSISDKYLKKCMCLDILKQSFVDFDLYSFAFDENSRFIFDFCFTFCFFRDNRIYIKTNKDGSVVNTPVILDP